jgi:hypothetical protein
MSPHHQTRQTNRTLSPYLRFAGLLLLTLAILIGALWTSGCLDCDDEPKMVTNSLEVERKAREARYRKRLNMVIQSSYSGGPFFFRGQAQGPPYPDKMKITWYPDLENCYKFRFYDDPMPEPGGPPYVWNLEVNPQTGETAQIEVFFDYYGPMSNSFTVEAGDQKESFSGNDRLGAWPIIPRSAAPQDTTPQARTANPLDDDYYFWETTLYYGFWRGPEMTTELCQRGIDFLQSGTTFAAVRFPVQPPTLVYSDPYTLPVAFRGEYTPTMKLVDYSARATSVLTMPLEYKFDYLGFMESELPWAVGEHWMALGVPSEPKITCPPGIDSDNMEVIIELALDFGGEKDACTDCVLPVYYCYEGEQQPMLDSLVQGLINQEQELGIGLESYQGSGITCLGPDPLRLEDEENPSPPFAIRGEWTVWITETQTISLVHEIYTLNDAPVTVNLDYTSTLDLPWGIYSGTWNGPDIPLVPLDEPLTLDAITPSRYFWVIADVPAGKNGPEILQITARSVTTPKPQAVTADLIWIGDWIPPSEAKVETKIYLPMVLR